MRLRESSRQSVEIYRLVQAILTFRSGRATTKRSLLLDFAGAMRWFDQLSTDNF
jgi:hypothetical protein